MHEWMGKGVYLALKNQNSFVYNDSSEIFGEVIIKLTKLSPSVI
jgi:hypothetical protein